MPLTFTRADSVYHVDRPVISLTPIVLFRRSVKSLSLVCKFIISPAFSPTQSAHLDLIKRLLETAPVRAAQATRRRTTTAQRVTAKMASTERLEKQLNRRAQVSRHILTLVTHEFEVHSILYLSSRLHSNRMCNVDSGFVLRIIPSLQYFNDIHLPSAPCFQPSQALQQIPKRRLSGLPR